MKNKNNKTCSNLLKYTLCEKTTTVPVIPANAGGTPWVIHLNKVSIRFRLRISVLEFRFSKSLDYVNIKRSTFREAEIFWNYKCTSVTFICYDKKLIVQTIQE